MALDPERLELWREAMRKVQRTLREQRERDQRSVDEFVAERFGWGEKETA